MRTIFALAAILFFISCQNEGRWYPSADVKINAYTEYESTSGRVLQITFTIHNSSSVSIAMSALTVKVNTNKHEYLQTTNSTIKINPGGTIAVTVSIPYLEMDEQVQADGIVIYDAFFD